MKKLLNDFYSESDVKIIKKAFNVRNIAQYYVDQIIPKEEIDFIISNASLFYSKSKEILGKINENNIKKIRNKIKENFA